MATSYALVTLKCMVAVAEKLKERPQDLPPFLTRLAGLADSDGGYHDPSLAVLLALLANMPENVSGGFLGKLAVSKLAGLSERLPPDTDGPEICRAAVAGICAAQKAYG